MAVTEPHRLAVRVTPDAARHIRRGHPWVFNNAITSVSGNGAPGDLAVIFDDQRKFMAVGLYDPESAIRIKILHSGRPQNIDEAWFRTKCSAAKSLRVDLQDSPLTNGYRCVHGENDGLPGVVLDRYADIYVLKLYSTAWAPHLAHLTAAIVDVFAPTTLVIRLARSVDATQFPASGSALVGVVPEAPVTFFENGLAFEADVVRGQKTGHFLDQRDNRAHIRSLARGTNMLDIYSCTGGFAVYAAAGGARSIHRIDVSRWAIEAADRNIANNHGSAPHCKHTATIADAHEAMDALIATKATFDLVVVDPPSFATRKSQTAGAVHAYRKLAGAAARLTSPGGTIMQASCSARVSSADFYDAVTRGVHDAGRHILNVDQTAHAADHPVGFSEGAYLKAAFIALAD